MEAREATQLRMEQQNPRFAAEKHAREDANANGAFDVKQQLPDGDVALDRTREEAFVPPACVQCGGPLKPDVIFHGECMPKDRRERARELVASAGVLLVVGSSLAVESARGLVRQATRQRTPVAIVNVGPTAADAEAQVVVHGSAGDVLERVAHALRPAEQGAAPTSRAPGP